MVLISEPWEGGKRNTFSWLCYAMLSELQKADVVLADSVPDCTRQELWNGRSVSEAAWPQFSCVVVPGSWQHCPLALYPQDHDQFPVGKSHGLRVQTVIYSPTAKTRGWRDSGCICMPLLHKQPHTHEAIVETGAVWVAHEGRMSPNTAIAAVGLFTSSIKNLPTTLLYLFPRKSASLLPALAERSEVRATGRAPPGSFCFTILHSCTARLWKKAAAYLGLFFFREQLGRIFKIRPFIWWISHGLFAQLWAETL